VTEPPHEHASVDDVARTLAEYEPTLRGVVVFSIDHAGVGRLTMGGMVHVAEVTVMIQTLQTLAMNGAQLSRLMSMDVEGHG
jgi:hypothetical protein